MAHLIESSERAGVNTVLHANSSPATFEPNPNRRVDDSTPSVRCGRSSCGSYLIGGHVGRRREAADIPKSDGRPARRCPAPRSPSALQPRAGPQVGTGIGWISQRLKIHSRLSAVDGARLGRTHDPNQPGRKGTGQHLPARTAPKQPSTDRAPRSHKMGPRASIVGHEEGRDPRFRCSRP